jgi:hypothetical protein
LFLYRVRAACFSLIWLFPDAYYKIMRKFTRLRAALVPYLADAALNTYDTGLGLMLPLYYNCQSLCSGASAHHSTAHAPAVLQLSMIGRRGVHGYFFASNHRQLTNSLSFSALLFLCRARVR